MMIFFIISYLHSGLSLLLSIFYYKQIIDFYKYDKSLGCLFYFALFNVLNVFFKSYFFEPTYNLGLIMALISTILIYFYIKYTIKKRKSY